MAKLLAYGGVRFPSQGSTEIQELVKYFESSVSLDDLQDQINLWLIFIAGPVILNRPSIREISFSHYTEPQPPTIVHVAQVHYLLTGDADDSPNL